MKEILTWQQRMTLNKSNKHTGSTHLAIQTTAMQAEINDLRAECQIVTAERDLFLSTCDKMRGEVDRLRAERKKLMEQEPVAVVDSGLTGGIGWVEGTCLEDGQELYAATIPPAQPEVSAGLGTVSYKTDHSEVTHTMRLPAARSAPAEAVLDVDWLANVIRVVDGDNKLGAGALAEQIVAMLASPQQKKEG